MKKTLPIPGSPTSASPTGPSPCAIWTSPAGAPASSSTVRIHSPLAGVSSDGLSTTPLPVQTAVATEVNGIPSGTFVNTLQFNPLGDSTGLGPFMMHTYVTGQAILASHGASDGPWNNSVAYTTPVLGGFTGRNAF